MAKLTNEEFFQSVSDYGGYYESVSKIEPENIENTELRAKWRQFVNGIERVDELEQDLEDIRTT